MTSSTKACWPTRSASTPSESASTTATTSPHKIAHTVRTLGIERFDLKYSNGPMPHEQSMRAIELYGTEVIPRVRQLLAGDEAIAV